MISDTTTWGQGPDGRKGYQSTVECAQNHDHACAGCAQFYKASAPTDGWKKGCADNWCKDPDDCPNKNFCTWAGITCTEDQKNVKEIHIGACNVQGIGGAPARHRHPHSIQDCLLTYISF